MKLKIVFMGTPEFAASSLKALIDNEYEIQLVITQPDRRGNRNKMILSPVKELAMAHGIEVAQPARLRKDEELITRLRDLAPDMIVVAAFGQILPRSVLDIPRLGCINVHGSLLPDLRGASPMQAAVLRGLDESGVTIMKMAEGIDTGDMISKAACDIRGLNIMEVSSLLADVGAKLLISTIPGIADGTAVYEVQDDSAATYASMISKKDGFTDFSEPADSIERKIRAYMDWPTCYTYLECQMVKLYRAEAISTSVCSGTNEGISADGGDPDKFGTVIGIGKNHYDIQCQGSILRVYEQQLQGKKRMSAGDFMRGHKLSIGDRFGALDAIN